MDVDTVLKRFAVWAEGTPDIRAAMVVGSRARAETPADEWVLFDGGVDVDFVLLSPEGAGWAAASPEARTLLGRGFRVLFDKDGVLPSERSVYSHAETPRGPTQAQFEQASSDFWYHAVWTAKKLCRGEVWTAKSCCDGYMKSLLLQAIEWHARTGPSAPVDTWFGGRFLERWADPHVVARLRDSFAHYDPDDVSRALGHTMALYRKLMVEIARRLDLEYPRAADGYASELVGTLLSAPGVAEASS